jgi:hypothetical protein
MEGVKVMLAGLLRSKRFDELLRLLDDPATRERLLDELDRLADESWTPDEAAASEADKLWTEVEAGKRASRGDSPEQRASRALAVALGAGERPAKWPDMRRRFAAALAACAAAPPFFISLCQSAGQLLRKDRGDRQHPR